MITLNRRLNIGSTSDGHRRIVEQARVAQNAVAEVAFTGSPTGGGGGGSTSTGGTAPPGLMGDVMDGFLPPAPVLRRRIYREMFHHDPIVGSGIDLLSSFPFSDFSLTGINDEMRLKKYASSVDMIDVRTLLPVLSTDYLVLGKFIGTLNWNQREKIYDALLPHNIDFCTLTNVPIYGVDPVVRLEFPAEIQKLFTAGSGAGKDREAQQQLQENLKRMPEELIRRMTQKGGMTLDSDSLVYIARPGMVGDYEGVSLLNRILPIWLMEKALIRGTLDQVWKRQRGILHTQIGGEDWEPNASDYAAMNDLILAADHDPTGAVITTRQGVNIQEIRRGDDFWRYDMFYEFTKSAKLQAMGISESFVTGDATIAAMEGAVNVTMQHFKAYRSMLTKQIFYDKVFPTVAIANGFKRRARSIVLGSNPTHDDFMAAAEERAWFDGIRYNPLTRQLSAEFAASGVNVYNTDLTQYSMPKVVWRESLDNNTDSKLIEAMKAAEAHGIPIPIRSWIAASGNSVEDLIEQKESDLAVRKFFAEYRKAAEKYGPVNPDDPTGGGGGFGGNDTGGGDGGFSFASLEAARAGRLPAPPLAGHRPEYANGKNNMPGEGGVSRGGGVFGRDFGDSGEPRRVTHRGTLGMLSRRGQEHVNDSTNAGIAHATVEARRKEAYEQAAAAPEPTRKFYPLARRKPVAEA